MTRGLLTGAAVTAAWLAGCAGSAPPAPPSTAPPASWRQHDEQRPQPPVARPVRAVAIAPPADATILFDGQSLDAWVGRDGAPAPWKVENGYLEVAPGSGSIRTKGAWGDVQLHVEWAAPASASGEGQDRGNSGVFLMGYYEVQVLDSYGNRTYPDGQAAAVYGQYPPLVNASLPPGEWQSYDIVFRRPRFREGGVVEPARLTVLHNGIVVQDNVALAGPTGHVRTPPYAPHADRLPLMLQDHDQPVRFRNIWLRELHTLE